MSDDDAVRSCGHDDVTGRGGVVLEPGERELQRSPGHAEDVEVSADPIPAPCAVPRPVHENDFAHVVGAALVDGAGIVCAQTIWRSSSTARQAVSILSSRSASRSGGVPSARSRQLRVADLEQAHRVALFADVTAEQLTRVDVDGVVAEEVVEDVGLAVGGAVPEQLQRLGLLEVGAVGGRDRHLRVELGVVLALELEAELVDALGERHAVLALTRGDGEEHGADVGVGGDVGPGRQVLVRARLRARDGVEQSEVAGLVGHRGFLSSGPTNSARHQSTRQSGRPSTRHRRCTARIANGPRAPHEEGRAGSSVGQPRPRRQFQAGSRETLPRDDAAGSASVA